MRKNLLKFISFVFIVTFLSSCGPSIYRLHLNLVKPDITTKGKSALIVSAIDQREYILSKQKDSRYISNRGVYIFYTKSNKPVSDDISEIFKTALLKNGYSVETVSTSPSADSNETLNKLKSIPSDKYILIRIKKLHLEAAMSGYTAYSFEFDIEIFDKNMKLIGSNSHKFEDTLGFSIVLFDAFDRMVARVKVDIEQLMNDERIKAALK